jgi:hypothetical protein
VSLGSPAAGRLAATVRPGRAGRTADSYETLVAARLRRLAATGRTGVLPFTGPGDGAIYLHGGLVVRAESARTPGLPATAQPAPLAVAEPVADAALDLLASQSSPSRFRPAKVPAAGLAGGLSVDGLLTEVARRQHVLAQLAAIVGADTTVVRGPRAISGRIQVSALQWALFIRIRDGATPRALAWELRRSVFGTTIDVYRLIALRLLSAAGETPRSQPPALRVPPPRGLLTLSFTRAVVGQKGGTSMPVPAHAAASQPAAL